MSATSRTKPIRWMAFLAMTACAPASPEADDVVDDPLIVIESPHVPVVVGSDTLDTYVPTVYAFFTPEPPDTEPSSAMADAARSYRDALQNARGALEAMGVPVVSVVEPPIPLGIAPDVEAGAGPRLARGGSGFLLVHPSGQVRRLDRGSGSDIVCAAAALFDMPVPPRVGLTCA